MLGSLVSLAAVLLVAATPTPAPAPAAEEASAGKTPAYPETLVTALNDASPAWLKANARILKPLLNKNAGLVVLGASIGADGAVVAENMVLSTGDNALDDLTRALVLAVEPFPPPGSSWLDSNDRVTCILRLRLAMSRRKLTLFAATACHEPENPVAAVAGMTPDMATAKDASVQLFAGWAAEASGDMQRATAHYRGAVDEAPAWDLATRALGLALVKAKKVPQAIPFLKTYVRARSGAPDAASYAREINRYEKMMAARIAEENRVRDRLSAKDIAWGVKKGYPLLEPCLRVARRDRRLAVGVDTLVLTWKIRQDGSAYGARVESPESLLLSRHADCIARVVSTWRFPRYSAGSEITAKHVPIKVRGAPRPRPKVASTAAPPVQIEEPAFSRCERLPAEITGHIRSRQARIRACILAERRREPRAPLPDNLPISFVVDSSGPVRNIAVTHRAYRTGKLATCIGKALTGSLAPSNGSDCPAEFGVDLRGFPPTRR
ncbi:MAG: hypothetical protein V3T05_05620 [Myxococcota bacterium]